MSAFSHKRTFRYRMQTRVLSPGSTRVCNESILRFEKNADIVFSGLRELVGLPIEELGSSSKFPGVRKDLKRF